MANVKQSSYLRDVLKRFFAHKLAMVGALILIVEILAILSLPSIMNLDPYSIDYMSFGAPPSPQHLLGTDNVGRDNFARLIYGGRVSLTVGIMS
ncbi:MAG TPA: peptide ABC transporter permease, partial [Firmicutes bacterium]|nr:peptide ABC transporter permease [Bacillota bacterium]